MFGGVEFENSVRAEMAHQLVERLQTGQMGEDDFHGLLIQATALLQSALRGEQGMRGIQLSVLTGARDLENYGVVERACLRLGIKLNAPKADRMTARAIIEGLLTVSDKIYLDEIHAIPRESMNFFCSFFREVEDLSKPKSPIYRWNERV